MEDINEEKINMEDNNTPQSDESTTETVEFNKEESVDQENTETAPEKKCTCCCGKSKLWIIIGAIIGAAAIACIILALLGKFSKYPGFKKDRTTGIYYQFHGDIIDSAAMPKTGDLVGILFSLRAGDSLLIPMMPNEMLVDSIYEGDFFAALRMMHVGDSATFIFNGKEFFANFFQGQEYPFGEDPLYADIKIFGHMTHDLFVKRQAEYERQVKDQQAKEDTIIQEYLNNHKALKKTEEGIYMAITKKSNGAKAEMMQNLIVHYTGRLLDGTVFDSSLERGEPFKFTLGAHQVIPGWEIALSNMHVGEKATILIPSALAYGERGNYAIPPFSPLVFDIEFIDIDTEVQ